MKKNVIIAISAAVLVLALAVGAFFAFGNKSGEVTPEPATTATAVPTDADASTAPDIVQPSAPSSEEAKSGAEKAKENAYADATEVAGFDKDQVRSVLTLAHDYSNTALTSTYFLSGDWFKNGRKMDEVDNYVGKYFDLDLRKAIRGIDTTDANANAYRDVATVMFYMDKTDSIAPHANCAVDATSKQDGVLCPPVVQFSKMEYVPTVLEGDSGIQVSYTASAEMPVTQNGVTKFFTATHKVKLNFVPNKHYDADTDPNKFVINYYDVNLTTSQLHDAPVFDNGGN